jgi:ubiquinone biosynthesis protein
MEFIDGVKITDTATIDRAGLDRRAIVQTVIRALVKQVLIDGFFHSDPHPGNLLLDLQTGTVTFLDLGLMGELTQAQRFDLLDAAWSFVHGDTQSLATVALRFTQQHGPLDERAFRAEVERLYYQYWVYASANPSVALLMNELNSVLTRYGLRLSSELTMAGKAVAQMEAIAYTLQPEWYWLSYALDEATTQLGEQFSADRIVESVKTQALRSAKAFLRELPGLQGATGQWLEQFRRGRFVVELNTDELAESVTHFSQSMRRVTVALILIGMLIGSAIASSLLVTLQDSQWAFLPFLAMGIFVASALLSVGVVLRMLRAEQAN